MNRRGEIGSGLPALLWLTTSAFKPAQCGGPAWLTRGGTRRRVGSERAGALSATAQEALVKDGRLQRNNGVKGENSVFSENKYRLGVSRRETLGMWGETDSADVWSSPSKGHLLSMHLQVRPTPQTSTDLPTSDPTEQLFSFINRLLYLMRLTDACLLSPPSVPPSPSSLLIPPSAGGSPFS